MNMHRSKGHHAWRPRMNADHEFNPFVSNTGSDQSFQHRAIYDVEQEDTEFQKAAVDEAMPPNTRDD